MPYEEGQKKSMAQIVEDLVLDKYKNDSFDFNT